MKLPMQAIARVEAGSLTPTLSRRERVSLLSRNDRPQLHPYEPSQLVPANACLGPANFAEHFLLLPPVEGRDEGRLLRSSRPGSSSPDVSNFWKTFLPMNRAPVAAGVPPAVEGGVSPPGGPRFMAREQVDFKQRDSHRNRGNSGGRPAQRYGRSVLRIP